jgi:serine/threonine protein kinase
MSKYSFSDGQLLISEENVKIPKINLIDVIGEGANGVVLKGYHVVLSRDVAVKIWLPRDGFQYPDKKRFFAEIRKISKLKRNRIITIYDADIIAGKYCYAILELVEGITLQEWLKNTRSFEDRLLVAKKIFTEVKYVHDKNIFHGDLHDRNILILENGEVKLLDFGTSIFSHVDDPHERESKILLQTALEIFPEEKHCQFINKNALRKTPPICVSYTLDAYIRILGFFRDFMDEKDKKTGQNNLTFLCALWTESVPFFNIQRFLDIFIEKKIDFGYLVKFISIVYSGCLRKMSPNEKRETMWLNVNDDDTISTVLTQYSLWQENFTKQVRDGTFDFSSLKPVMPL